MTDEPKLRYRIDSYGNWIKGEGVPVYEDYGIDLFSVETKPWARFGVKGAACHLKGRGDFASMFLFELPPGGSSTQQRHLFEEVIYVLEGTGSTQLEFPDGAKRSFEWGERSLFAIPLNARHRHFNGSGQKRALMVSTTNMPLIMNVFHNERFIFDTNAVFEDRMGKDEYYNGEGDLVMVRPGNHMWETNFVPDLEQLELQSWEDRGGGSSNIMFVLADSSMHAHISEMPPGTYKKAHRHGPGAHVMCVVGTGYSLLWFEDQNDFLRIDWKHGVVFPPADRQLHQHFNTSNQPARYLATNVGGIRYPFTAAAWRSGGDGSEKKQAVSLSIKEGGDQIEYEDQDPRIHPLWLSELKNNGGTMSPKMEKYFPSGARSAAE
ncbi:MAG TPA: cupin domain-containing protein [Stellaceae bacterium]|nr:cupin domain-containing protein [Stellaceae bacterium]